MSDNYEMKCFKERTYKAKSKYICIECHRDIRPGDKYLNIAGVVNNSWESYKQCLICAEVFNQIVNEFSPHYGEFLCYGDLKEWIQELSREGRPSQANDILEFAIETNISISDLQYIINEGTDNERTTD